MCSHLEVVHPHIDEICAAPERKVEAVLGQHSTRAQNLKGDPGFLDSLHQGCHIARVLGEIAN